MIPPDQSVSQCSLFLYLLCVKREKRKEKPRLLSLEKKEKNADSKEVPVATNPKKIKNRVRGTENGILQNSAGRICESECDPVVNKVAAQVPAEASGKQLFKPERLQTS